MRHPTNGSHAWPAPSSQTDILLGEIRHEIRTDMREVRSDLGDLREDVATMRGEQRLAQRTTEMQLAKLFAITDFLRVKVAKQEASATASVLSGLKPTEAPGLLAATLDLISALGAALPEIKEILLAAAVLLGVLGWSRQEAPSPNAPPATANPSAP